MKQDSSHNQSDLFKQNESQNSSLKIEEEAFFYDNQIQFPNNSKSKKNKDFNLENKHKKKTFYKDKMASLMEE